MEDGEYSDAAGGYRPRRRRRVLPALLVAAVVLGGAGAAAYYLTRPAPKPPLPQVCTAESKDAIATLDPEQAANAATIAAVGVSRSLPERAVTIALATAMQESKLINLSGGDRDSAGLFQQRPSQGWGTLAQVTDPIHASNAFYDRLVKISGYQSMPLTEAAQEVQRSGAPDAYAQHEPDASSLSAALTGSSPATLSCQMDSSGAGGTPTKTNAMLTRDFGSAVAPRTVSAQRVQVAVRPGSTQARTGWAVAQWAVAHAMELHVTEVKYDRKVWRAGTVDSPKGWQPLPKGENHTEVHITLAPASTASPKSGS